MKGDHLGEFEELTLLAVRALGTGAYAVSVQQFVEKATDRAVSIGAVYAALARLEDKAYLQSTMTDAVPVRGGKAKRVYTVNPAGMRTLKALHRIRTRIWDAIPQDGRS